MDKKSVKINAEKIWHTLNEVKSVSISELARILNLSIESTALAVGWLAVSYTHLTLPTTPYV